jgi:proliferating cell nuclear antigen
MEEDSQYFVDIETNQTSNIKNMISILRSQFPEVNILFTPDKIEILQADASNTVIIHVELFSNEFNKYKCENKYLIGVELSNLDKILKGVLPKDILKIFIENPEHSEYDNHTTNPFGLIIERPEKNQTAKIYIDTIDINNEYEPDTDQVTSYEIELPSGDFCDIINQLKAVGGDVVRIIYNKDSLSFYTKGDSGRCELRRDKDKSDGNMKVKKSGYVDDNEIISIYVKLQKLVEFSKCSSISQIVTMFINNNKPIILQYKVGNLGLIKLITSFSTKPESW